MRHFVVAVDFFSFAHNRLTLMKGIRILNHYIWCVSLVSINIIDNENREIFFIRQQNHTEIGPSKQSRFRLDKRQFRTDTDVTVVRNVRYVSVCTAGFHIKKYPWCVNGRSNGDVAWKKQDVFKEVQC
jgi:hypothetical protein